MELLKEDFWRIFDTDILDNDVFSGPCCYSYRDAHSAYHSAKSLVEGVYEHLSIHGKIGGFDCDHVGHEAWPGSYVFGSGDFYITPRGHIAEECCNRAIELAKEIPVVKTHIMKEAGQHLNAASSSKQKTGNTGGKPRITQAEERKRMAVIDSWERARDTGINKPDFCKDKEITKKKLDTYLDWKNTRDKRRK